MGIEKVCITATIARILLIEMAAAIHTDRGWPVVPSMATARIRKTVAAFRKLRLIWGKPVARTRMAAAKRSGFASNGRRKAKRWKTTTPRTPIRNAVFRLNLPHGPMFEAFPAELCFVIALRHAIFRQG